MVSATHNGFCNPTKALKIRRTIIHEATQRRETYLHTTRLLDNILGYFENFRDILDNELQEIGEGLHVLRELCRPGNITRTDNIRRKNYSQIKCIHFIGGVVGHRCKQLHQFL